MGSPAGQGTQSPILPDRIRRSWFTIYTEASDAETVPETEKPEEPVWSADTAQTKPSCVSGRVSAAENEEDPKTPNVEEEASHPGGTKLERLEKELASMQTFIKKVEKVTTQTADTAQPKPSCVS